MTSLIGGFVRQANEPLQATLRRAIVTAIGEGRLIPGQFLPPSRALAVQLGIARNTVAAAYDGLVESGILDSTERRGVFVASRPPVPPARKAEAVRLERDWSAHLKLKPSLQRNIVKPVDWQSYPYPFVYGQVDPTLFPLSDWRTCSRNALGRQAVNWWAADHATADDPMLIEQIRRHILPRRGIHAREEEILITLGSQHGLYLLMQILVERGTVIGIEDPGYPDARNIALLTSGEMRLLPIDDGGLVVGAALEGVDLAIVTPANQCPTMVTMPRERRLALLDWASSTNALIIEDEYESEISGDPKQLPALAALDTQGRVAHLGTFSKVLAPGVRLGFMVAAPPLIAEARALRRLVHRSVPLNNQRTAALFIADGHYEGLVRRLGAALAERRAAITAAIEKHLKGFGFGLGSGEGGTSILLRCPAGVSGRDLADAARNRGVVIERGDLFFADPARGAPYVRLGFSSIPVDRIEAGIVALAEAAEDLIAV